MLQKRKQCDARCGAKLSQRSFVCHPILSSSSQLVLTPNSQDVNSEFSSKSKSVRGNDSRCQGVLERLVTHGRSGNSWTQLRNKREHLPATRWTLRLRGFRACSQIPALLTTRVRKLLERIYLALDPRRLPHCQKQINLRGSTLHFKTFWKELQSRTSSACQRHSS